jgi:hypothetical protein
MNVVIKLFSLIWYVGHQNLLTVVAQTLKMTFINFLFSRQSTATGCASFAMSTSPTATWLPTPQSKDF